MSDLKDLNENQIKQIIAEREELQNKLAVAEARITALKENLGMAQAALGLVSMESLPKEVMDDAKARVQMGLPQQFAIQKALEQFEHNKRLAKQAEAAQNAPAKTAAESSAATVETDAPPVTAAAPAAPKKQRQNQ